MFKDEGIEVVTSARITRGLREKSVIGETARELQRLMKPSCSHASSGATVARPTRMVLAWDRPSGTTDHCYREGQRISLETTAPDVWPWVSVRAARISHIAFDDFRIVRDNILGGQYA